MLCFMPRPILRPTDKPVVPREDRSRLDSFVEGYLRTTPEVAKTQAVNNPFNPLPSVTQAVMEGRRPTGAEAGMDAGFLAAGFIPFGKAAGPAMRAIETAAAQEARRNAISRLLNKLGPDALSLYLDYPITAYRNTMGAPALRNFFRETTERIPAGTQMYRAPSAGQVMPRRGSQSVPLPREIGAEWMPGRIQSATGSEDLQKLGQILKDSSTGGGQEYAPGMVAIEAMEDLPGVYNLNDYFDAISARGLYNIPNRSTFVRESVLGPQTRYVVRDFQEQGASGFPTWYLNAYAR
jgi:hypothetical protein